VADLQCHFPRDGETELYQSLGGHGEIIDPPGAVFGFQILLSRFEIRSTQVDTWSKIKANFCNYLTASAGLAKCVSRFL